MEPKIQLLYDYEILNIAKQESLALLPMIGSLQEQYPNAEWEDVVHTVTAYIAEHGFEGVPTTLVPVPVVEPEPLPVEEIEEPVEVAPTIAPVVEEEFEDFNDLPAKKPLNINIRNILQEVQGKV